MKFVDQATIEVRAGKGGHGCLSFRRERFIPRGGPDGGDGGRGGDVWLVAERRLTTLIDFRYRRLFRAGNGRPGMGQQRNGADGSDLTIPVPLGTVVRDADTGELIGELLADGDRLLVARGGERGLGNMRFKSSTQRAPRRTTPGGAGEVRRLELELRLLAEVGLAGLPNAGKSSLLRALTRARPRVADYPFTTLHPQLGVVDTGVGSPFVVADVPGLIAGAADGAGLGHRFLRHLLRTRILLQVVDLAGGVDPLQAQRTVADELARFDAELARRPRWLVLNKVDRVPADERAERVTQTVRALGWRGPVFAVSALTGEGCAALAQALQAALEPAQVPEDGARSSPAVQTPAVEASRLHAPAESPAGG